MSSFNPNDLSDQKSTLDFKSLMLILAASGIGIVVAMILFPFWAPHMATSMLGQEPKVFWYLSRATAFVSMTLLWISMVLGLAITNKMARIWPGGPTAFALHEYTSVLGLVFVLFHALILLGDHYISMPISQILIPFSATAYKPLWVGFGQMAFYLWVLITSSFYIREFLGKKTWRALHYLSFVVFLIGLVHGLSAGTDASTLWATRFYWFTGGSVLFLLVYRVLASVLVPSSTNDQRADHSPILQPAPIPSKVIDPVDRS